MLFPKESTNFAACFTLNKQIMSITETQQALAFAAMCVDLTAQAEGCSRREMYGRMKKVGLIHGLTTKLDPLHTQSKEYIVTDLRQALHRLEASLN